MIPSEQEIALAIATKYDNLPVSTVMLIVIETLDMYKKILKEDRNKDVGRELWM